MTTAGGPPCVLVLALGRDPMPAAMTQAVLRWESAGTRLCVLTLTPRTRLSVSARQVTLLSRPAGPDGVDPATAGAPRSIVRKALRRSHLDPVRWAAVVLVLASPVARRLVAGADVVLAADPASVPLGWALARTRGEAWVFRSVSSAGRALTRLAQP